MGLLHDLVARARSGLRSGRRAEKRAALPEVAESRLAGLDPRFRSRLLSMYRGEPQLGADGELHAIDRTTAMSPDQGMWLYELCMAGKPAATVEIGMAYGYSTLYFLAAIAANQRGSHTAIDPFQGSTWHGIGAVHARAALGAQGADSAFRLIEDRSDRASADLSRAGARFDMVLIDGNHRFDDVLVDFYLYAPLCAIGGLVVLDDVWMSSIRTVVSYIRANRSDFVEIASGQQNVAVFRKVSDDSRSWRHFRRFPVESDLD